MELLAPAKELEYGKAAINHGADAVYIGAHQFGARVAAGNSINDIEKLINYAHIFNVKVYVTVNTLLLNDELEDVQKLIRSLYNVGVDALIIQDTGILEMDLPPIKLHASTQMNNITPEKILFLEKCGFHRVILPREMSVNEIIDVRKQTTLELESFVHGALCVCYSGQCYLSLAINGRSGNRGDCSQPCRSKYDLVNQNNDILIHDRHLLSLRDLNASQYLQLLYSAGVTSFKIEGRLKDICYVKNITAFYRQLIDNIAESTYTHKDGFKKSSSGKTTFFFNPDPERTFNRNFTNYFLEGHRTAVASFMTQKSLGKKIGKVVTSYADAIRVEVSEKLNNGDGICYFGNGVLDGFFVNRFNNNIITPNKTVDIKKGTIIYRNKDFEFEKALLKDSSAERKIDVNIFFDETDDGFKVIIEDEDGCQGVASVVAKHDEAINEEKAKSQIIQQLSKLGQSSFSLLNIEDKTQHSYFIPASVLNELRRQAVENLIDARLKKFHSKDILFEKTEVPYIKTEVDYTENITNELAEEFYRRHKVEEYELGPDASKDLKGKTLMTTKYCLRYEIGQCLKSQNVDEDYKGRLFIENNGKRFELKFDCKNCRMQVINNSF